MRTASEWVRFAESWRTFRSSISTREAYAEISRTIDTQRSANEEYLERMRHTVEAELRRRGIPARVEAREQSALTRCIKSTSARRSRSIKSMIFSPCAAITDSVKN